MKSTDQSKTFEHFNTYRVTKGGGSGLIKIEKLVAKKGFFNKIANHEYETVYQGFEFPLRESLKIYDEFDK